MYWSHSRAGSDVLVLVLVFKESCLGGFVPHVKEVLLILPSPLPCRPWNRWTSSCRPWTRAKTGRCGYARTGPGRSGPWTSRSEFHPDRDGCQSGGVSAGVGSRWVTEPPVKKTEDAALPRPLTPPTAEPPTAEEPPGSAAAPHGDQSSLWMSANKTVK